MNKYFWACYAAIMKGLDVRSSTDFRKLMCTLQPKLTSKADISGGQLIIYNSARYDRNDALLDVVYKKNKIVEGSDFRHKIMLDAGIRGTGVLSSEIRKLVLKIVLSSPVKFIFQSCASASFMAAATEIVGNWFQTNRIFRLELFTSNSRFVEMFRIAAICKSIPVTEYLHGICSDSFANYYEILDRISFLYGSRLTYINHLPGLPQPSCVMKNMLLFKGKEVFFQNEKPWINYNKENISDVLVVGSAVVTGDYLDSRYFKNDCFAIKTCLASGYKVIYCPHPQYAERVKDFFSDQVGVGSIAQFAKSSSVIVGHYSTVIFSAHLIGLNVLLFEDGLDIVPDNVKKIFKDVKKNIFNEKRLVDLVENSQAFIPVNRDGYSLH